MAGYTKVFTSMLDSTVWLLSKEARILWITLILKKNRNQVVKAPIPGLAHAARLTVEETEVALKELQAPDKYSQSQEHEGRRVILTDKGWLIVNGARYRDMLSEEDRRQYQADWQAKKRAKKNAGLPLKGEDTYLAILEREGQEAADAWLAKREGPNGVLKESEGIYRTEPQPSAP